MATNGSNGSNGSASASPERGRIAYFALDLPHKGQASYVHINEIVENLRRLGWHVDLFTPEPAAPDQARRAIDKWREYVRVTRRVRCSQVKRRPCRSRAMPFELLDGLRNTPQAPVTSS